ncbi:MAG: DUF1549 domain-containing protein [Planctomycetales bacterium]
MYRHIAFIALCCFLSSGSGLASETLFREHVAPLLIERCLSCHNGERTEGGLSLATAAATFTGGDSGEAIVQGDAAGSYLVERILPVDGKAEMPEGQPPLRDEQIELIEQWIDQGADWPEDMVLELPVWWSFAPLEKPTNPAGQDSHWVRNPVDQFILDGLTEKHLHPSVEADRRTLLRRLSYDLLGLPPSLEEVERFVNDSDSEAYEKLVDRMLASPRYGERWGRHWLDVVHYGETHGYDKDKMRQHAWPYRDYVIRSFNADKPYTRFIHEQVAGDVLFPGTVDGIEALGFIAAGPWDHVGHAEVPETKIDGKVARHLDRDDMVRNTMMTFMSLTVGCAQCHDHKFDPITQEDYYSLQAVFAALDRADHQYHDDPELTLQRQSLRKRGRTLQQRERKLKKEIESTEKKLVAEKKKLAEAREKPQDLQVVSSISRLADVVAEKKQELAALATTLDGIRKDLSALPEPKVAYIGKVHYGGGTFMGRGYQGGRPRTIHVLNRGSVTTPGEEVGPGALNCIEGPLARFQIPADASEGARRQHLAAWLTDLQNPLPWRSLANRIWQFHFGRGLVDTPGDFGRMGSKPSHPELLEYLAAQLRECESIKQLHRLIVTSATYRQTSTAEPTLVAAAEPVDAENHFYWRMNRRRLEAEAVRDAVLHAAGRLDLRMGGPSFQDFVIDKPEHSPHYEYHLHDPTDPSSHRRAVYRFVVRSQTQPFLTVMDCADPSMLVAKRNVTISPLQSLALLNNQLMLVMAAECANQAEEVGATIEQQVTSAFRNALSRDPSAAELSALSQYANNHGLANTCRVIYNLNEFVFID